jgi:hypothetical protein
LRRKGLDTRSLRRVEFFLFFGHEQMLITRGEISKEGSREATLSNP